jgi:hypothetical protein
MGGEGAGASDWDVVRYFIDEGYGCDPAYIAEETGIPVRDIQRIAHCMEQLVRASVVLT